MSSFFPSDHEPLSLPCYTLQPEGYPLCGDLDKLLDPTGATVNQATPQSYLDSSFPV